MKKISLILLLMQSNLVNAQTASANCFATIVAVKDTTKKIVPATTASTKTDTVKAVKSSPLKSR